MFINYNPNTGYSVSHFRDPKGYYNSDILGLIEDIIFGGAGSCPLDGAKDALEDGAALAGLCEEYGDEVVQLVVEELYFLTESHEA